MTGIPDTGVVLCGPHGYSHGLVGGFLTDTDRRIRTEGQQSAQAQTTATTQGSTNLTAATQTVVSRQHVT